MRFSFLGLGVLALSLAACSSAGEDVADGDDVSEQEATVARITPGEFKLYAAPHATPSPSCDVYTSLTLTADSHAKLVESLDGICDLFVAPNPREYRLRLAETSCGSKIYTGSIRRNGQRHTLRLTDHRARTCRDVVPAKIVVEEHPGLAFPRTRYSLDAPPPGEEVTVEGTLKGVVGIGGESTGFALQTSSALEELVLDDNERGAFAEGLKARVRGHRVTLMGVETGARSAIDVDDLLLCPTAHVINCMPPFRPESRVCSADRSWIEGNCPDVTYVE